MASDWAPSVARAELTGAAEREREGARTVWEMDSVGGGKGSVRWGGALGASLSPLFRVSLILGPQGLCIAPVTAFRSGQGKGKRGAVVERVHWGRVGAL